MLSSKPLLPAALVATAALACVGAVFAGTIDVRLSDSSVTTRVDAGAFEFADPSVISNGIQPSILAALARAEESATVAVEMHRQILRKYEEEKNRVDKLEAALASSKEALRSFEVLRYVDVSEGSSLTVRETPGGNAVATLAARDVVSVRDCDTRGGQPWCYVTELVGGQVSGWVAGTLLQEPMIHAASSGDPD